MWELHLRSKERLKLNQRSIMADLYTASTNRFVRGESLWDDLGQSLQTTEGNIDKTNSLVREQGRPSSSSWQPGWRQTPWFTMISILLMLACMGAAAGIIIGSNGQIVGKWWIDPAVILAFLSAVWNYSLGIVLARSIAITWWRNALNGTKLESLHYIWDQGANPFHALRSSLAVWRVLLLAWLVFAVQIGNNPLLQRSTRIRAATIAVQDKLSLDSAPRLPDGYLGVIIPPITNSGSVSGSRNGLATTQDWWWNRTISTANKTGYHCDGTCTGEVEATGFTQSCSSSSRLMDISAQENNGQVIFAINFTLTWKAADAPILTLTTLHSSAIDSSCTAYLSITTCIIQSAIIKYPVQVQNSTISLEVDKLQNATVVSKYVSPGDFRTAQRDQGAGPLEGLIDFIGNYMWANDTLILDPFRNSSLYSGGLIPDLFFLADPSNYDPTILNVKKCALKWSDPTQYILNSMHQFLFLASLRAHNGTDALSFTVQRSYPVLVFHSNYRFLAVALTIMLITLIATLLRLWGWWELGRNVSLSPLELAKAFQAPVMQRVGEKSTISEILKVAGNVRVQYNGESIRETRASVRHRSKVEDVGRSTSETSSELGSPDSNV
jgi:hypothetical protein